MLTKHTEFDWDDVKAAANLRKHRVDFAKDAAPTLLYPLGEMYYNEEYDTEHSVYEDRWFTVGPDADDEDVILWIVWTPRVISGRMVTRLITARRATKQERKDYAKQLGKRTP